MAAGLGARPRVTFTVDVAEPQYATHLCVLIGSEQVRVHELHEVGVGRSVEDRVDGREAVACHCDHVGRGRDVRPEHDDRNHDADELEHCDWDLERPGDVGLLERHAEAEAVAVAAEAGRLGAVFGRVGRDDHLDAGRGGRQEGGASEDRTSRNTRAATQTRRPGGERGSRVFDHGDHRRRPGRRSARKRRVEAEHGAALSVRPGEQMFEHAEERLVVSYGELAARGEPVERDKRAHQLVQRDNAQAHGREVQ